MQISECDQPGTLVSKTLRLLSKDKRGLFAIAEACDVPFYWLRKFSSGEIPNPSVNRVQYLYERLTGEKLL